MKWRALQSTPKVKMISSALGWERQVRKLPNLNEALKQLRGEKLGLNVG